MKIPQYALGTHRHLLVKFFCKTGCHVMRYGQVSTADPSANENINSEPFVTCLKCGGRQQDKANWTIV